MAQPLSEVLDEEQVAEGYQSSTKIYWSDVQNGLDSRPELPSRYDIEVGPNRVLDLRITAAKKPSVVSNIGCQQFEFTAVDRDGYEYQVVVRDYISERIPTSPGFLPSTTIFKLERPGAVPDIQLMGNWG